MPKYQVPGVYSPERDIGIPNTKINRALYVNLQFGIDRQGSIASCLMDMQKDPNKAHLYAEIINKEVRELTDFILELKACDTPAKMLLKLKEFHDPAE